MPTLTLFAPTSASRAAQSLRWWICAVLFASTAINYIDRQTLALLAPILKVNYHWTNRDYAGIIIAFRIAYVVGQFGFGRILDIIGVRRGLTISVLLYSIASILTSFANGLFGFSICRALLGMGESANWPAATKAVSERFSKEERALATAFFDSGSSIGAAVAPFLVLFVYTRFGVHAAFIVPGCLGLLWLIVWRKLYHTPAHPSHAVAIDSPRLLQVMCSIQPRRPGWRQLLSMRKTWAVIIARSFTDPVWFFVTDWFPVVLAAKGFTLHTSVYAIWIPFVAGDLGNFFSGWASGWLVRRGWPVVWARKAFIVVGGTGMLALIPAIFCTNLYAICSLFGLATFAYACFSTIANVLPADLFEQESVGSISGLGGGAAGIGTIFSFLLIGIYSDSAHLPSGHQFDQILAVAGLIPFLGTLLVFWMLRGENTQIKTI